MNADLFAPCENVEAEARWDALPDLRSLYAREVLGAPDGWDWYSFSSAPNDVPEGFFRMEGAVAPLGVRTRRPNWRKRDPATERVFFVKRTEYDGWAARRAADRAECEPCRGTGYTLASFGVGGTKYRVCARCSGSGKPAAAPSGEVSR